MTPRRGIALAALCVALAPACKDVPRPAATLRLTPIEALASPGDAASLTDLDTTTTAAIDLPTRLRLRFARPVEIRRLKVHGARALAVEGAGVGALGPADEAGWSSAGVSAGAASTLAIDLVPLGPGASLGEIEVWGDGLRLGDADPAALAWRSRRGAGPAVANAAAPERVRWLADDVIALAATPDGATLRPAEAADGEDCVRFRFEGGAAVRGARRAYLAYEANLHRAIELTRSLGSGVPSEALWLGVTNEATTVVDEIDPRRLTGSDEVRLCLPVEATAAVRLDDARLLLVLESGTNAFDRDARRVLAAAADGDASTATALPTGRVELGLDRLVAIDRASIRLASGSAVLRSVGTTDGTGWSERLSVPLSEGVNSLGLVARRARALALAFGGVSPAVAELEVGGSGVGPRVGAPRIVIAHPSLSWTSGQLVGERFGGDALVAGWAESPAGPGAVEIDGAPVSVDGAFGVALRRPVGGGSWAVTVRARFPDGSEAVKVLRLDDDRAAEIASRSAGPLVADDDTRFGAEDDTTSGLLTVSGGKVRHGTEVEIEAGEGAVGADTRIGIARKGPELVPKLDPGMVNVTAPARFAYRFLPAGQRFARPVKLSLPYDPELLPEGVLPEEIQTYYYDDDAQRWLTLPRVEVRREDRKVVSETTHFTFMINAVLVLPDHPGPASFDPTSIQGLRAADPSAGIDLVEPPSANSQGAADVSFPIRLPRARGAYQPALEIAYDQAGGNGWLGLGWDLAVSSVAIDTRYGAPTYDGEERYLLDGAQLVPASGSLPCTDGSAGRPYMARVEREFPQVVRCGADATQHWFEVTDRSGTLFVYGREPTARLSSYVPHLFASPRSSPAYDVAQWFLERVVDTNGNLTRFAYQLDDGGDATPDPGSGDPFGEPFRQLYLSDVWYSGRAARVDAAWRSDGPYHVQLAHRPGDRTDLVTSGRLGFKVVTRKLLGSIQVELNGTAIRRYELDYEPGDFGLSLLRRIRVLAGDGTPFYQHEMEYTRRAEVQPDGTVAAFAPGIQTWEEPDGDDDHGITSSWEWGLGGHAFVGVSVFQSKESGTVGVGLDLDGRWSRTDATFVDLNGDALPDRMFRSGGAWLNRPQGQGTASALLSLGREGDPPLPAQGPVFRLDPGQSLGSESSTIFTAALQVMGYGLDGSFGGSWTKTRSRDLVLDANGDGLPDLVSDGQVWFNQPGCTEAPCFRRGIPAPVLQTPQIPIPLPPDDSGAGAQRDSTRSYVASEDVLLEWTAPFSGIVDVHGVLAFAGEVLRGERHDGVRLRIFHSQPPWVVVEEPIPVPFPRVVRGAWEQVGPDVVKYPREPDDQTPTDVARRVVVEQGDLLYFVLSTLEDFPVGTRPDRVTRYSPEEVGFAPVVTYLSTLPGGGVDAERRAEVDATGAPLYVYDAAADFRLAGNQQVTVTVPRSGVLRIASRLEKYPSPDDLVACARLFAPGTYLPDDTACEPNAPGTPIHLALPSSESSTRTPSFEEHVEAGTTFVFWVKSRLPIDPGSVDWEIDGEMTCVDRDGSCVPVADDDPRREALRFRATPNVPLHVPIAPIPPGRSSELASYLPEGRVPQPFVPPADGTLSFRVTGSVPWFPPGFPIPDRFTSNPVTFAVRTPGQLHRSWTLPAPAPGGWTTSFDERMTIRVERGVPVFFEGHGELEALARVAGLLVYDVSFDEDDPPPPELPLPPVRVSGPGAPVAWITSCGGGAERELGNWPLLGGGFHGWRYGAWQGADDEPFLPWVFRSPREDGSIPTGRAELKRLMKDPDWPEGKRARLLGVLSPSADGTHRGAEPGLRPGVAAWVSQDANAYLLAGGMNAARRGARITGPDGDAIDANVGFAFAGRSAVGTTLTGGLGVGGVLSLSISSGMSHQEEDLLDVNGDLVPDVIGPNEGASFAVPDVASLDAGGLASFLGDDRWVSPPAQARITDPATLEPRGLVLVPVQPGLAVEIGGQAGLGITEAVKARTSKNRVVSTDGRLPEFSLGVGVGLNASTTVEDLVDVNGDGLPDAVRRKDGCDGFSVRLNLGTSFAVREDCLRTHGWGAAVLGGLADALDPSGAQNPDDDPDTDTAQGVAQGVIGRARDPLAIRQASTVTLQGDLGGGAIDGTESFGVSVSSESSLSWTSVLLTDVTGDGLADLVAKDSATDFRVAVNRGYGFSPPQVWHAPPWPSGWRPDFQFGLGSLVTPEWFVTALASVFTDGVDTVEASGTHTDLPTIGFVFTTAFPLAPPSPSPWLQLSFGGNATLGRGTGFELGLQDIDGDGVADHVLKKRNREPFAARVSRLGGGNLLRRVTRPLGGVFDLEYVRVGNTVELPESRWAVSRVTLHDGVGTGTGHDLVTRYEYGGGIHDRNEREFLGFRTVTQRNGDEGKVVRTFRTDGVAVKGLLEDETILDAQDRKLVETHNEWSTELRGLPVDDCKAHTPINLRYLDDLYCAATFVRLEATEQRIFEGEPQPLVRARQSFDAYDAHGNVTRFHDWGDLADADDDVYATVAYGPSEGEAYHCVGAPTEILVGDREDGRGVPLRRRSALYDGRCNPTRLGSRISAREEAVVDLEWYPEDHPAAGNLKAVTSPLNHRSQRYAVQYEYDGVVATYVGRTSDAHGYVSEAEVDPAFGEITLTRDTNGQETRRALDRFGRPWRVAAPGAPLDAPTIEIAYAPEARPPTAVTRHRLPGGGTLDVVVVSDGVGRVLQTKKTAEVWSGFGEETRVGWAITGHRLFDAMGRVGALGQAFFDDDPGPAYVSGKPRNATRFTYDGLGRTTKVVEPSGATTRFEFGFGTPANTAALRRRTSVADAMEKVRVTYQDATDATVAIEEHVEGRTPTTHYAYDRLGQLVSVTDAAGNETRIEYDGLGRRTLLSSPDAGTTTFAWDPAGNLTSRRDAMGTVTTYVYDLERLKEVHYPTARRDVAYEYGPPGAPENGAGRITRVDDEVGEETRGYDALGNLARSTRTVDPLRPGDRTRSFTTTFQLDPFGRVLSMVYPDGEVLTYGYDAGGLLASAVGKRAATKQDPAQVETYLAALRYDEFGQRRHQRVGNGVVTRYAYDPLSRRLSWLHAQRPGERLLQDLTYSYDAVGNVLSVRNALGEAVPPHAGAVELEYRYDDLHRLVWAHGEAKARPRTTDTFTSTFAYSDIHNMQKSVQDHRILHAGGAGQRPPHTNHELAYEYGGAGPHRATRIGDRSLVYDDSGNVVAECRDPADASCTRRPNHLRRYAWTEENLLDAVIDGGGNNATRFFYDAAGERVAKLGRGGESLTVGQFWSLKGRRAATKHVFAGAERIASKLLPPPGWDDVPRGDPTPVATITPEPGCIPSNYQPQKCPALPGGEPVLNDYYADAKVRPETYFYHPDHLGSTGWVTDQNGRVHEHVEYFPYGAVWRDPRSDVGASPVKGQRFLFTGKELDEETGLYPFGARYYDPVRARWTSPDPALVTLGGQLTPELLTLYAYAGHSPVTLSDPDGRMPPTLFPAAARAGGRATAPPDAPTGPRVGGAAQLATQAGRAGGSAVRTAHAVAATSGSFRATGSGDAASGQPVTVDRHLREGTAPLLGGGTAAAVLSPAAGPASQVPASMPPHVFWSGGGLEHAGTAASEWAQAHGARTLEHTAHGQRLVALDKLLGFAEVQRLWKRGSEQFAERASGEVHVFLWGPPRETSIWKTIEEPALKRNPKVTRIVEHHLQ